jgi:hypothetical protein
MTVLLAPLLLLLMWLIAASADDLVEVGVLLFPGAGCSNYTAIAAALRSAGADYGLNVTVAQAAPLPLWKVFLFDRLVPRHGRKAIAKFRTSISASPTAPLFTLGHSLGGLVAVPSSLTHATGHIGLGCAMNSEGHATTSPHSASTYPKPLLQVFGDHDGYLRASYAAPELAASRNQPAHRSAVVLLPGVSHEQMGSGDRAWIAQKTGRMDYTSPLQLDAAHGLIAEVTAAFIGANVLPPGASRDRARGTLQHFAEATEERLKVFASELTDAAHVRHAQRVAAAIAGGAVSEEDVVVTLYKEGGVGDVLENFIYSKPYIEDGVLFVTAFVEAPGTANWMKGGGGNAVAPGIIVKAKSPEAMGVKQGKGKMASELTDAAVQWATEHGSTGAAGGKRLRATADEQMGGGPEFIYAKVEARVSDCGQFVEVSSPVLKTGVEFGPRFGGMMYSKSLTRAQALEWALFQKPQYR